MNIIDAIKEPVLNGTKISVRLLAKHASPAC